MVSTEICVWMVSQVSWETLEALVCIQEAQTSTNSFQGGRKWLLRRAAGMSRFRGLN